jgi:NAD(P)H-hydrate repair Nnr-like enzyme with NAD(P)H-hydrate epimerase domain
MKPLIYVISLLMAAMLGFGIHRASPCTVKTVAEILNRRKIYMLKVMLPGVLCMGPSAREHKNFIKADQIRIQIKG